MWAAEGQQEGKCRGRTGADLKDSPPAAGALAGAATLLLPAEHEGRLQGEQRRSGAFQRGTFPHNGQLLIARSSTGCATEAPGQGPHLRRRTDEGGLELDDAAVGHDGGDSLHPVTISTTLRGRRRLCAGGRSDGGKDSGGGRARERRTVLGAPQDAGGSGGEALRT